MVCCRRSAAAGIPKRGQGRDLPWKPAGVVPPMQYGSHLDMTQFPPSLPLGPHGLAKSRPQEAAQAPIRPATAGFASGRRGQGLRLEPQLVGESPALAKSPNALRGPQQAPSPRLVQPKTPWAVTGTCSAPPGRW